MGELSDRPTTLEAVQRDLAALNRGIHQAFVEIGRFAQKVREFLRRATTPPPYVPPPHPFRVGSYDLECKYPGCGRGPEEH